LILEALEAWASPSEGRRSPVEAMPRVGEAEPDSVSPDRSAWEVAAERESGCQTGAALPESSACDFEANGAPDIAGAWMLRASCEAWTWSLEVWASEKASLKVGSSAPGGMLTWLGIGATPWPSVTFDDRPAIASVLPGRRRAS
jgi:hypothetical protein